MIVKVFGYITLLIWIVHLVGIWSHTPTKKVEAEKENNEINI